MAEEHDTPTPEETAPGLPDENAVAAVEEAAGGESTPEPATPSEPAAPREPVEVLSPQERRLRARAARSAWRSSGVRAPRSGALAERVAALVTAVAAIYIALNEGFANWQAVWFCAAVAGLSVILLRARDVPDSK